MLMLQLISYGQTYPSKLIIGGDTLVVITLDQVRDVNIAYVERDEYFGLSNQYKSMLDTCAEIYHTQAQIIDNDIEQLRLKENIIGQQKLIIGKLDEQINKLNRVNNFNKWERNILFIAGVGLLINVLK